MYDHLQYYKGYMFWFLRYNQTLSYAFPPALYPNQSCSISGNIEHMWIYSYGARCCTALFVADFKKSLSWCLNIALLIHTLSVHMLALCSFAVTTRFLPDLFLKKKRKRNGKKAVTSSFSRSIMSRLFLSFHLCLSCGLCCSCCSVVSLPHHTNSKGNINDNNYAYNQSVCNCSQKLETDIFSVEQKKKFT